MASTVKGEVTQITLPNGDLYDIHDALLDNTTTITPVTKKTVVTNATMPVITYSAGNLSFTNGSVTTGDSVTNGTAITVAVIQNS